MPFKDYRFDITQNGDAGGDGENLYIPHDVWINYLSAEFTKRHPEATFVIDGDPRLTGGNYTTVTLPENSDGTSADWARDSIDDEIDRIYETTFEKEEMWVDGSEIAD